MADAKSLRGVADSLTPAGSLSSTDPIVVLESERSYPWPAHLAQPYFGHYPVRSSLYFRLGLLGLRQARPDYRWIPFFQNTRGGYNAISDYPEVIQLLETLFEDELKSKYSEAQYALLVESELVVVGVHKATGSIACYFSSSYAPSGSVPDFDLPATFACHGVVSRHHQHKRLFTLVAGLLGAHGQPVINFFRKVAIVLRTNNSGLYRTLSRFGELYRSDQLGGSELSQGEQRAKTVVQHMHHRLFHLTDVELPLDRPLRIDHHFEDEVTIDGLAPNEIIYVCNICRLGRAFKEVISLFMNRRRKR